MAYDNDCYGFQITNERIHNLETLMTIRDEEQDRATNQIVLRLDRMETHNDEKFKQVENKITGLEDKINDFEKVLPKLLGDVMIVQLGRFTKWIIFIIIGGGFVLYSHPYVIKFFENLFGG